MCVMNLRRKNLRNRSSKELKSSPPNVKLSKRKSTGRPRRSSKVTKLDDLENSYGAKNFENSDYTRIKVSNSLLSSKGTKHSHHGKYKSRFLSSTDSCKDPLTSNSFNSSLKPQSVTTVRKRKSTHQNCPIRSTSQAKKRKKSKSVEGKDISISSETSNESRSSSDTLRLKIANDTNSKGKTNRYTRRISGKNATKSNERLSDCLVSEKSTRVSPRLAAKKEIENKENKKNNANAKNRKVSVSTNVTKKTKTTSLISLKNSKKSIDETSSCTKHNFGSKLLQDNQKRKGNLKTTSNQKHSKQNSRQNSSLHNRRLARKKTSSPNVDSVESDSNNASNMSSKATRSSSRSIIKPKTFASKDQLQKSNTTSKHRIRRHTVPLQKKKKIRTNSKNITDITMNFKSPSKEPTQGKEFSYHLNDVPTDDLNEIPFYSPNNATTLRQSFIQKQGTNFTSTPNLKKSTKYVRAKKRGKKLNDSCSASKKSIPGKGSLKRKRLLINSLKEKNEEYEDDIFENCSFGNFKNVLELDDDSDTSLASIATPKCPFLITSNVPVKTPHVKDCYSPLELLKARKVAEEYMYRRNKKWKKSLHSTPYLTKKDSLEPRNDASILGSTASVISEKKKLDFMSVIEDYKRKSEELRKEKESDEDEYFSDVSS